MKYQVYALNLIFINIEHKNTVALMSTRQTL